MRSVECSNQSLNLRLQVVGINNTCEVIPLGLECSRDPLFSAFSRNRALSWLLIYHTITSPFKSRRHPDNSSRKEVSPVRSMSSTAAFIALKYCAIP